MGGFVMGKGLDELEVLAEAQQITDELWGRVMTWDGLPRRGRGPAACSGSRLRGSQHRRGLRPIPLRRQGPLSVLCPRQPLRNALLALAGPGTRASFPGAGRRARRSA